MSAPTSHVMSIASRSLTVRGRPEGRATRSRLRRGQRIGAVYVLTSRLWASECEPSARCDAAISRPSGSYSVGVSVRPLGFPRRRRYSLGVFLLQGRSSVHPSGWSSSRHAVPKERRAARAPESLRDISGRAHPKVFSPRCLQGSAGARPDPTLSCRVSPHGVCDLPSWRTSRGTVSWVRSLP